LLAHVGAAADLGRGSVGLQAGVGREEGNPDGRRRREGLVPEQVIDDLIFEIVAEVSDFIFLLPDYIGIFVSIEFIFYLGLPLLCLRCLCGISL